MFDYYRVAPDERCPWCGGEIGLLQGKAGPCLLVVWEQGERAPTADVGDAQHRLTEPDQNALRHPSGVYELSGDCRNGHPIRLDACFDESGRWTTVDLSWERQFVEEKRRRERAPDGLGGQ